MSAAASAVTITTLHLDANEVHPEAGCAEYLDEIDFEPDWPDAAKRAAFGYELETPSIRRCVKQAFGFQRLIAGRWA